MALCKAVGDEPQGQQVKLAARPWPYGEDVFWQVLRRWTMRPCFGSVTALRHLLFVDDQSENESFPRVEYIYRLMGPPTSHGDSISIDEKIIVDPVRKAVSIKPLSDNLKDWFIQAPYYPPISLFSISLDDEGSLLDGEFQPTLFLTVVKSSHLSPERKKSLNNSATLILAALLKYGADEAAKVARTHSLVTPSAFASSFQSICEKYRAEWSARLRTKKNSMSLQSELDKDLALATFILELHRNNDLTLNVPHYRIIDVGCGRGFLANILSLEGLSVVGIDSRHSDSWSLMSENVKLIEKSLSEGDMSWLVTGLAPAGDTPLLLVGNRSDELTPWIIWAASFAPDASVLLLPCCFWDFRGRFGGDSKKRGLYRSYLDHLTSICKKLAFNVTETALSSLASDKCFLLYATPDPSLRASIDLEKVRNELINESEPREGGRIQQLGAHHPDDGY